MTDDEKFNREVFYSWLERAVDGWWTPLILAALLMFLVAVFP